MKYFRRLTLPYIFFATVVLLIPMALIVFYGLSNKGNDIVSFHFTLEHIQAFFADTANIKVLFKSLQLALYTTVICLLIGYPIAYAIANIKQKNQAIMILLVTLPMWINMLLRTYAWQSILNDQGLLNRLFGLFGIGPFNFMYTTFAVLLGMVYNFLPFMILSIYTVLSKLDRSLIEASQDLGATPRQTFTRVIFPLSMPGVIAGIILVFLPAASTFVIPAILGGAQNMLIGNLIERQFISVGDWNFGSAISLILAAIILVSMIIMRRIEQKVGAKNE